MQATLTGDEWRLVSTLRDMPEGPLRDDLVALLDGLFAFVGEPRCSEAQADGVPCASAKVPCDRCEKVRSVLSGLREQLLGR